MAGRDAHAINCANRFVAPSPTEAVGPGNGRPLRLLPMAALGRLFLSHYPGGTGDPPNGRSHKVDNP